MNLATRLRYLRVALVLVGLIFLEVIASILDLEHQPAREQFVRELATLEEVLHPDGMISLDLKGLFMQDLVVVRRLDGSLVMRCVPDSEKDTALFAPPPPPPAAAPKLEER